MRSIYQPIRHPEPLDEPRPIWTRPALIDFTRRRASARGLYRVFNAACYRFFRSNSAPPLESDTPFATSATLPATPANTYADGTWYLSMSYFDGVLDSGFLPIGPRGETYLVMEIASGAAVATRPGVATNAQLQMLPGGIVRVTAYYLRTIDGLNAATEWALAYTTNGSTPPSGSPSITVTMSGPIAILAYSLPAQVAGTVVKVQLQARRGGTVYSLPGAVLSITVPTFGATAPLAVQSWLGALPEGT